MAVKTVPERIPIIGLENIIKMRPKAGLSFRPSIALLMVSIPNIKTAKPIKMDPKFLRLSCLENIIITTPMQASTGVKDVGLKICTQKLSPLMPERLSNQDVTVVPTFAPKIMPIVWDNFMIPEFTNPTSITVVAEEL